MSTHEVQSNLSAFSLPIELLKHLTYHETRLNDSALATVLNKINEFSGSISIYDAIEGIETVNSFKIKTLERLLKITLKKSLEGYFDSDVQTYKGNILKLSDIKEKFLNEFNTDCKHIRIFAAYKIFIDADFSTCGRNLFIIAPHWEFIGQRTLSLNGEKGKSHDLTKMNKNSNNSKNLTGDPGAPGHPGCSAGNFFGIGMQFSPLDEKKIIIHANGDKGGPGQHGGDGMFSISIYYILQNILIIIVHKVHTFK